MAGARAKGHIKISLCDSRGVLQKGVDFPRYDAGCPMKCHDDAIFGKKDEIFLA